MKFQDLGYQVVLEKTFFEQKLHMAEHTVYKNISYCMLVADAETELCTNYNV